jgi:hypothetical protein
MGRLLVGQVVQRGEAGDRSYGGSLPARTRTGMNV